MSAGQGCALVVFARRPRPGRVKTRLARALGPGRAAAVYARLLDHARHAGEAAPLGPRFVMPASRADVGWFGRRWTWRGWRVRAQGAGDLGRRMARACARVRRAHGAVVLIGSDVVDLLPSDLAAARDALAGGADAAIAPATDGGYWLVALARPVPGLFAPQRWGGPDVYAETVRRLERAGVRWKALPPRRDVDTVADLRPSRMPARR